MEVQKQTFSVGKGKAAKRLTAVVFAIAALAMNAHANRMLRFGIVLFVVA